MAPPSCLLQLLLLLLASPLALVHACRTGTYTECQRAPFVPGHNLVGEGFDVAKLQRKGAYVVDMQTYRTPNNTCTLCANPLMASQLQKLPVSVLDWRAYSSCSHRLHSATYSSVSSLLHSSSSTIQNDWTVGLDLSKVKVNLQLSGTDSADHAFASSRLRVDKSTFSCHQLSCSHYSYRVRSAPPLSPDFRRALAALPRDYSSSSAEQYRRLLSVFGTHYIQRVRLGGRLKRLTSIRTCLITLNSLTSSKVKNCLSAGLSVGLGLLNGSSSSCSQIINNQDSAAGYSVGFLDHRTDVSGGNGWLGQFSMTRNDSAGFHSWLQSLKTNPDLVSYSLLPLHELVADTDVKQNLRNEIRKYLLAHALRKTATTTMPTCSARPNVSPDCCPQRIARGRLVVTVLRARRLKGDRWGRTEGYVKLWYGSSYQRSRMIRSNYPTWNQRFDFGYVDTTQLLRLEVWDEDWGRDDRLGRCNVYLQQGTHSRSCRVKRGPFYFKFTLTCDPHLTGSRCEVYSPQP
ncbi:perforin-1-like [Sardina pilchardus]|uniref:perforin-1-like n=1 Tax=Sardina pilchardus TaxID=27697 RepID=UPI002E0F73F5